MATQSLQPTRAGKYVTFQLSRHYFAVEARRVRQVVPTKDVQQMSSTPPFVQGVLVAKGRRVPVVDIRDRLNLTPGTRHARNSVLIIDFGVAGVSMLGILTDRVTDVVDFKERDFRENVVQLRAHGKPYGRPKTLLQLDGMFTQAELAALREVF